MNIIQHFCHKVFGFNYVLVETSGYSRMDILRAHSENGFIYNKRRFIIDKYGAGTNFCQKIYPLTFELQPIFKETLFSDKGDDVFVSVRKWLHDNEINVHALEQYTDLGKNIVVVYMKNEEDYLLFRMKWI